MTKRTTIAVLALCAFGCGSSGEAAGGAGGGAGSDGMAGKGGGPTAADPVPCVHADDRQRERVHGRRGRGLRRLVDCLDSECRGKSCGSGLTCAGSVAENPANQGLPAVFPSSLRWAL